MLFWRLVFLTASISFFGLIPLSDPFLKVAGTVSSTLEHAAFSSARSVDRWVGFYLNVAKISRENIELQKQNLDLLEQVSRHWEERRELEVLREEFSLAGTEEVKKVASRVVGQKQGEVFLLVIDKGENFGIREGNAVTFNGFLVGEVLSVGHSRSEVRLAVDPSFTAAVLDQESLDRARGIARGSFGGKIIVDHVLPQERVEIGDIVITSGLDEKFYRGLVVGKVSAINEKEGGVSKEVLLTPALDYWDLEMVFVVVR